MCLASGERRPLVLPRPPSRKNRGSGSLGSRQRTTSRHPSPAGSGHSSGESERGRKRTQTQTQTQAGDESGDMPVHEADRYLDPEEDLLRDDLPPTTGPGEVVRILIEFHNTILYQVHTAAYDNHSGRERADITLVDRNSIDRRYKRIEFKQFPVAYTRICEIVRLGIEGVLQGATWTFRSIWYVDKDIMGSPDAVRIAVDDITATLGLSRRDLHMAGTERGVVSGAGFTIHYKSGAVRKGSHEYPLLIPLPEEIEAIEIDPTLVKWIGVIEKESATRWLRDHKTTQQADIGPGLLATGRGNPDVATRSFVARIARENPNIPLGFYTDCNPYGAAIAALYMYGTRKMQHEKHLNTDRGTWLGLRVDDILQYRIHGVHQEVYTDHDWKTLYRLLDNPDIQSTDFRQALADMHTYGLKAEIEATHHIDLVSGKSAMVEVFVNRIATLLGMERPAPEVRRWKYEWDPKPFY